MNEGVYVVGRLIAMPKPYTSEKNSKTYYKLQVRAGDIVDIDVDLSTWTQASKLLDQAITLSCRATKYGLRDGTLVSGGAPK